MGTKIYFTLAFRLIVLFLIAMLATVLPEYLNRLNPKILGDVIDKYGWLEYGPRHYLLNLLGIVLFFLSVIDIIIYVCNIVDKKDTSNK